MANIMITSKCNLSCPYCFANEFVNLDPHNMTLENFAIALDFVARDRPTRVGLIGGEPTLHPQFTQIIQMAISHPHAMEITVYTNGVLLDKYASLLSHPKIRLLVNWNSPEILGDRTSALVKANVDRLIFQYNMRDRLNVGLNLYDPSFDYSYMIPILKEYALRRVRISVTVPNFREEKEYDVMAYFGQYKTFLLEFFRKMGEISVLPYYDCNKPPFCVWTEEEQEWLRSFVAQFPVKDSDLIGHKSFCYPVIDILHDLKAVRCFGMSDHERVDIRDFHSISDLVNFYLNRVDGLAYQMVEYDKCQSCYAHRVRQCTVGCIAFHSKKLDRLHATIQEER